VFRTIPGLERANFVRLGQIHRNCYINAPTILDATLQTRERPELLFAGQISGVEGYTESAATGILAGINAARLATGRPTLTLPEETMLGGLCRYLSRARPEGYQPTNAAFGLLPEPTTRIRGRRRERRLARSASALQALDTWIGEHRESLSMESAP
jgi:methylenetetrahydrofolate--tRNA-(uracil-5-)-methyltransferase